MISFTEQAVKDAAKWARLSLVCARCHAPAGAEKFNVGRYIYGACCILKVEQEKK